MLFTLFLQLQVFRNIWDKPRNETGDDVNCKLKHEHESEATCDHLPVLFVLLVRRKAFKVTRVPEMQQVMEFQSVSGKLKQRGSLTQ